MTARARAAAAATLAFGLGWAAPAAALCPNCLGQQQTLTPTMKLVGLFLLVPFAVAAAVIRIVRRMSRDATSRRPRPR